MKSYPNIPTRTIRAFFPSITPKVRDFENIPHVADISRDYTQKNIYNIRKSKPSISSISNLSGDTQSTGDRILSTETSLNDISRLNPSSKRSCDSRQVQKRGFVRALYDDICSLQDITSIEEPIEKEAQLPHVTAKCWVVMDSKTGTLLFSKKEKSKREVASLTKMMNLLCVCNLMKKYKIDPKKTHVEVSRHAASMNGTSACLKSGDVLSIWDLLHGLMLPSGNDAAMALAENFGTYIYLHSDEYKARCERYPDTDNSKPTNPAKYFIRIMNETAKDLGLTHTYYANPHGLVNQSSYSTAADQAKLSYHILKLDIIRQVVNRLSYTCEIEQADGRKRIATWENTNKLLGKEGWNGLKTGITTAAGPCLSAHYENKGQSYIEILLSSVSKDIRWIEAPKLVDWTIKNRHQSKAIN